jgi:3-oxoacyl-[acyl-carrier-protein] synthase II
LSAVITGIGWVTVGGAGMGRSDAAFGLYDGVLPEIKGKILSGNHEFPRIGRLDRYSRLGLQAIAYALQDAGLDRWEERREIGIVASTVLGCLETDLNYYETVMNKNGLLADPNLFAHTLSNTFLGHASTIFGLTGTNFVINEKTDTGKSAILSALDCLSLGECGSMLAGICDLECPPGFPMAEKPAPGSVFIVLEQTGGKHLQTPYGIMSADRTGAIFFNKTELTDISMCIRKCLELKA